MKKLSKKGFNIGAAVTGLITLIIGVVVLFNVLGSTSGTLTAAADNVSSSGLPLAGLFGSGGVIILTIMAGILTALIIVALKGGMK